MANASPSTPLPPSSPVPVSPPPSPSASPLPTPPAAPLPAGSSMGTPAPAAPTMVSLSFAGPIQHPASRNLRNACCHAVNNRASEIQILFSSNGGAVDEGFSLYNFLRALPVKLTMHCVGYVDSIALVVFLAGERRFCCSDSTFMFHDFGWGSPGAVNFTRLQVGELRDSLERSRTRTHGLLKTRAKFTDTDIADLQLYERGVIYDAAFAKSKGLVHDIKEALVPVGGPIYNIEY